MQKGWTPADFKKIEDEYLWNFYIVAFELAQEKENRILKEYAKAGVFGYGG